MGKVLLPEAPPLLIPVPGWRRRKLLFRASFFGNQLDTLFLRSIIALLFLPFIELLLISFVSAQRFRQGEFDGLSCFHILFSFFLMREPSNMKFLFSFCAVFSLLYFPLDLPCFATQDMSFRKGSP